MANPFNLPMVGRTLRNLVSRPATRRYPAEVREPFAGSRGQLVVEIGTCVFCGLCARRCPAAAISVDREARRLEIDQLLCVTCGVCVDACNKASLHLATTRRPVHVPSDAGPAGGRPGREVWIGPAPATPAAPVSSPVASAGPASTVTTVTTV